MRAALKSRSWETLKKSVGVFPQTQKFVPEKCSADFFGEKNPSAKNPSDRSRKHWTILQNFSALHSKAPFFGKTMCF